MMNIIKLRQIFTKWSISILLSSIIISCDITNGDSTHNSNDTYTDHVIVSIDRTKIKGADQSHFWSFLPHNRKIYYRNNYTKNTEDFNGTGPHHVNIYMEGRSRDTINSICVCVIDIVDRKTGAEHSAIISDRGLNAFKIGDIRSFSLDNIRYDFTNLKCPNVYWNNYALGSIKISRTFLKKNDFVLPPIIADDFVWKLDDEIQEKVIQAKIANPVKGSDFIVSNDISNSREVSFQNGSSFGMSFEGGLEGTLGKGIFPAGVSAQLSSALQFSYNKSVSNKVEQTSSLGEQRPLEWETCDHWLAITTQRLRIGTVSLPKLNIPPQKFTIIVDQRVEVTPLCSDSTNIASLEAIKKANLKIHELGFEPWNK